MYPRGHRLRALKDDLVRLLVGRAWTDADLEALLDEWPGLRQIGVDALTRFCTDVAATGATPTQTRRWAASVYQVTPPTRPGAAGSLEANEHLRAWHNEHLAYGRFYGADVLVEHYVEAAGEDHDLGRAAFAAGLTSEEVADRYRTGTLTLDGLRILAVLRASS